MMTEPKQTPANQEDEFMLLLQDVKNQLSQMDSTVNRRLDEVSAEVNATCQMIGMSEDALQGNFSEIFSVLKSVSFSGDGSTAANTGVELDAVLKATENAAHTILDATDKISDITVDDDWDDKEKRDQKLEKINNFLGEIVIACSFQDLTSQRINKTLENIHAVEEKLSNTLSKIGISAEASKDEKPEAIQQNTASQDDIDALFD